jgi:hypothetical protein
MKCLCLILILLTAGSLRAMSTISTIAGSRPSGFAGDGSAAVSATLNNPTGVALDTSGNIFVADRDNHVIRRIDAVSGLITTVVGNGTAGLGASGSAATGSVLKAPNGVAIDTSGNLFVADTGNNRVVELASGASTITVIAGTGVPGFFGDGAAGSGAMLSAPAGVAVDSAGIVFVADTGNNRVRSVAVPTTGIINTVAGNGTLGFNGDGGNAILALLNGPTGITLDSSNTLYIADQANHRIRKVDGMAKISTFAGTGIDGMNGDGSAATTAQLSSPTGVSLDSTGALFVADTGNSRIRRVDGVTGLISTVAGTTAGFSGDGDDPTLAQLNGPTGVATAGTSYVIADQKNQRIRLAGITSSPPPSISNVTASPTPAPILTPVTFSATATTSTNKPLSFNWNFGDNSPIATGQTVTHPFATDNGGKPYNVIVTVADGIQSVTGGVSLLVLEPNSGALGLSNVSQGKTVRNPVTGLQLGVPSAIGSQPGSNGGVLTFNTDTTSLTTASAGRSAGTISVKVGDSVGATSQTGPTLLTGPLVAHRFTKAGMFVTTSTIVDATDSPVIDSRSNVLRVRKTVAISEREAGNPVSGQSAPGGNDISSFTIKGKFRLQKSSMTGASTRSAASNDMVSFSGTIELPGGLDISQTQIFTAGIGNVIDSVNVSAFKGAATGTGILKKVQIKYPSSAKKSPVLPAQQQAKVTLQLSAPELTTMGFDTEGVTGANIAGKNRGGTPLQIQVLLLFAGESYELSAPVTLTINSAGDAAQIGGRSSH